MSWKWLFRCWFNKNTCKSRCTVWWKDFFMIGGAYASKMSQPLFSQLVHEIVKLMTFFICKVVWKISTFQPMTRLLISARLCIYDYKSFIHCRKSFFLSFNSNPWKTSEWWNKPVTLNEHRSQYLTSRLSKPSVHSSASLSQFSHMLDALFFS